MKEFNKESLGWLFGFIKGLAEALKSNRRFYPKDDDADKLRQLYQQLISQQERQMDENWIKEKAKEMALEGDFGHYMFSHRLKVFKKIICSIVQEIQKPRILSLKEFQVEAKKLFERSKSFKKLYDVQVYLSALIVKLSFYADTKPRITKEFVEKWRIIGSAWDYHLEENLEQMFKEAGCEVEK